MVFPNYFTGEVLETKSLMQKGAIPQYILTVVVIFFFFSVLSFAFFQCLQASSLDILIIFQEPHEDHPFSYVVKYKNQINMECVPSEVISKMWPQVIINCF